MMNKNKHTSIYSLILLYLFVSCSENKTTEKEKSETNERMKKSAVYPLQQYFVMYKMEKEMIVAMNEIENKVVISDAEFFDYSETKLKKSYSDTAYGKFSDNDSKDRFTFFVPGGLISETNSALRVTNVKEELVYEHVFPTSELINGYALAEIKNDEQMENYLLVRANSFIRHGFIDLNELGKGELGSHEYLLNEALPEGFENYEAFQEAKKDRRLMLCYSLHEEDIYFLVYSKELKKAVRVYYCC